MRRLLISGLVASLTGVCAPAAIAGESASVPVGKAMMRPAPTDAARYHDMRRWHGGNRAPGGWNNYRRPAVGYFLPRYWIQPTFYISNYGAYGLPAPQSGYGWSRYYDDAVLTDRYGRVYDSRDDVHWDEHEGGHEAGSADDRSAPPLPYEYGGAGDSGVTYGGGYSGRWVGTWYGDDGRVYSGEYRADNRGGTSLVGPVQGHWRGGAGHPHWSGEAMDQYGYGPAYGGYYGYGAPVIVTTTVTQPTVTTRTYVEEKVVYERVAVKKRRAHKVHRKPRPVCSCGS